MIGSSFGGAVAVYAAGTNPRIAAVISNGGWGRAEDVVGKIAPRPLLIHAAKDFVTPTEQSIALFERAGHPAELHLFSRSASTCAAAVGAKGSSAG